MITPTKPHISNLKVRVKAELADAKTHCDVEYTIRDDAGEEGVFLILSREFAAGIRLLDKLVQHDRFTSLGSLRAVRDALLRYRDLLRDAKFALKEREVTEFLNEISADEASEFGS
jgi:hypothetical protein